MKLNELFYVMLCFLGLSANNAFAGPTFLSYPSGVIYNVSGGASTQFVYRAQFLYDNDVYGSKTNINMNLGLPAKAVIVNCFADIITSFVGAGASVSVGFNTGTDMINARSVTALPGSAFTACTPQYGTTSTYVKITAQTNGYINISGGTVTQGKMNIFVDYLLSN